MKSWILEVNLQLPLYQPRIIPNYNLNMCSYTYRYINVFLTPQRNFSLQQREFISENHNQSKSRVVEFSPKWSIYKTTPVPKAQEAPRNGGRKGARARRTRFAVRLCLLEMTEAPTRSTCVLKHELNKDHTNILIQMGKGQEASTLPRYWEMRRETVFHRNEYINWLSSGHQMVGLKPYTHKEHCPVWTGYILYICVLRNYI